MDIVWAGLVRNFNHLCDVLLSAGSQFSLTSLACAFVIAVAVLALQRRRKGRRMRLRALMRALFPRRIVRSPSTAADVGYFLFNTFVYAGIFGMAAVSYQFLTNGVLGGMVRASSAQPAPSALPVFVSRSIITRAAVSRLRVRLLARPLSQAPHPGAVGAAQGASHRGGAHPAHQLPHAPVRHLDLRQHPRA